jgi:hypothetical protein
MLARVMRHAVTQHLRQSALVPTLSVVKWHRTQTMALHKSSVALPIHFAVARTGVVHTIWRVVMTMAAFLVVMGD